MAFSPETLGALKNWAKQYISKIIGINGIRVGTVTNGSIAFPTTRLDGSSLHTEDYVEVANGSSLPFTVAGITFTTRFDRAIWSGSSWGFSAGSIVESGEVSVSNKAIESISGLSNNQNQINVEIVNNIKDFPAYEDLDNLLPAQITTRVYRQTEDSYARKAGLYWYNADSLKLDKWETLGGGGIDSGSSFPSNPQDNDWFYLTTNVTVSQKLYKKGLYRYTGQDWEYYPSQIDYTDEIKNNIYNKTNLNFNNDFVAIKIDDVIMMSGKVTLKTPMTDYQDSQTQRKLMEIPNCLNTRTVYLYVTTTGGILTCEEDRHEFYDQDGSNYVDPNGRFDVQVSQLAAVRRQEDGSGGTLYYYVRQSISTEGYMLEETDGGVPIFKKTVELVNNKSNTTIYRVIKDPGYIGVGSEEEEWQSDQIDPQTGETKKTNIYVDVPCYKVSASEIKGNSEYMYKSKLAELGCFVDDQGRVGKYEFTPDIQFADIMADTSSRGFAGTCRFVVENVKSKNQMRELHISPKSGSTEIGELTIAGDIPVTSVDLTGVF